MFIELSPFYIPRRYTGVAYISFRFSVHITLKCVIYLIRLTFFAQRFIKLKMYLLTLCQFSVKLHCDCHETNDRPFFIVCFLFCYFCFNALSCFPSTIVSVILRSFNFLHYGKILSFASSHLICFSIPGIKESILHFNALALVGHLWIRSS